MDRTLALNKNIVSRKKLIGIANFVAHNSEARFLSRGTQILSTEQEIRDTKKANVLLPLLTGIQDVEEVLSQAKAGGVKLDEIRINEMIVNLANEKVTKPIIWRPRDGEVIQAETAIGRIQGSFQTTATIAKDRAYYANILSQGTTGVQVAVGGTSLKSEIVESVLDVNGITGDEIRDKAIAFANQLRIARNRIKKTKDEFLQSKISSKDICIIVSPDGETVLENDARYNMFTDTAVNKNGALNLEIDGMFDKSPVLVSKQLPDGVDFMVMYFGSAVSLFALRSVMNMDKIVGVNAYATSMEFDEGTGVFLPHLITIGVQSAVTTTYPPQKAVGFNEFILDMNKSVTEAGNINGTEGLPAPLATDTLVTDDVNKDGTTDADEVATFDAKTWYSADYATDKVNLTSAQKSQLKKGLGLPANATDATVQTELDKRA